MLCNRDGCTNEANPTLGSGRFCSRKCSNSRVRTKEVKQRISLGVKRTGARRPPLTGSSLDQWKVSIKETYKAKLASTPFEELSLDKKRRRVIEEQNGCCADCGLSEWKGNPITLELDHKDGINDNNTRENLWAICPNCHSYTETWRGRNKPRFNGETKVSDEVLLEALKVQPSIRKALLSVGLAGKGGNYVRAKRLLETITTVP